MPVFPVIDPFHSSTPGKELRFDLFMLKSTFFSVFLWYVDTYIGGYGEQALS